VVRQLPQTSPLLPVDLLRIDQFALPLLVLCDRAADQRLAQVFD